MRWYESHVGDLATERNQFMVHSSQSRHVSPPFLRLLKTPVCQPLLSDHQRGERQTNFSDTVINLQTPSFPIDDIRIPQPLGKSAGFSFPARPATMCVLAAAPTNLISRFKHRHLVSDKRASERPH